MATTNTGWPWASRVRNVWTLSKSQTRSVESDEADMTRLPLVETTNALTGPVWPAKIRADRLLSRSHTRNVPSPEPEIARRPSGVILTEWTQEVWPANVRIKGPPGGARLGVKGRSQGQALLSAAPFSKTWMLGSE